MKGKTSKAQKTTLGKDELNFAEFPLALIGKRPPANVKTLHFCDETTDRATGRKVERRLTVSAADVLGLPTAVDDEVMLGCLQLSHRSGFASPKVRFTRSEFLDLLGWKRSGHHYLRLSESLRRWKGTLVISENGFWDNGKKRWVNDSFSLLDRVHIAGHGREQSGNDDECYFVWGDFMWQSILSGNLRTLDFQFIKSLESNVSKRLYRWLGKRFYHSATVTIDLKRLAFEKIGYSRNMHTGQIKEKLAAGHEELRARGFCRSEYVERGRGKWDVVYQKLPDSSAQSDEAPQRTLLAKELRKRGVEYPESLLKHSQERITSAIENYDDRQAHGESIEAGWLVKCITAKKPYPFRRGYQAKSERVNYHRRQQQQVRECQARETQQKEASAAERQRFNDFFDTLTKTERQAYEQTSLNTNTMPGRVFRARLEKCKQQEQESISQDAMFAYWLSTQRKQKGRL